MDWEDFLANITLMDDVFTNLVFKYKPGLFIKIAEIVFNELFGKENIKINPDTIKIQEKLPNIHSKEVVLDVTGKTYDGEMIGIDFQVDSSKFPIQRGDYYSSAMETSLLEKGEEYINLPQHHLIVFSEGDIVGNDQPISIIQDYDTISKKITSNNHKIYINLKHPDLEKEFKAIFELAKDFLEKNPDKIKNKEIREAVKYFKESEEGMELASPALMKVIEKYREEIKKENDIENAEIKKKLEVSEKQIYQRDETIKRLQAENQQMQEKYEAMIAELKKSKN